MYEHPPEGEILRGLKITVNDSDKVGDALCKFGFIFNTTGIFCSGKKASLWPHYSALLWPYFCVRTMMLSNQQQVRLIVIVCSETLGLLLSRITPLSVPWHVKIWLENQKGACSAYYWFIQVAVSTLNSTSPMLALSHYHKVSTYCQLTRMVPHSPWLIWMSPSTGLLTILLCQITKQLQFSVPVCLASA